MPIPLQCACGQSYQVKDDLAGRKVRCRRCYQFLSVPVPSRELNLEDNRTEAITSASPSAARTTRDGGAETIPILEVSDQLRDWQPPTSWQAPTSPRAVSYGCAGGEPRKGFGTTNAGVFGGLTMMLVAVAWFVGGLCFDVLFYYPPILFILGCISVVKGFLESD